jgi:hypothetical protein
MAGVAPRATRRRALLAALALGASTLAATPARARSALSASVPPEVGAELAGAWLIGASRLRYYGFHVYDIRLWSDSARVAAAPADHALALELVYARSLRGRQIAERTLEEMRGIAPIAADQAEAWLAWLIEVLPDVREGDRITGIQRPGQSTRLFVNGRFAGELRDADFTRLFFAVWLSEKTSQPRLRQDLLSGQGGAS